jgi:hypothetical protein
MAEGAPSATQYCQLNLCVVTNGERRLMSVSSNFTPLDIKAQLALDDGFEDAATLFGPLLFRGKKLDDGAALDASGVKDRDKLMVSYAPGVRDTLAQILAVRVEMLALEDAQRAGTRVHPDLVTRQMLRLDELDLGVLPDDAREGVRAVRKGELRRLAAIETGDAASS